MLSTLLILIGQVHVLCCPVKKSVFFWILRVFGSRVSLSISFLVIGGRIVIFVVWWIAKGYCAFFFFLSCWFYMWWFRQCLLRSHTSIVHVFFRKADSYHSNVEKFTKFPWYSFMFHQLYTPLFLLLFLLFFLIAHWFYFFLRCWYFRVTMQQKSC